MQTAAAVDVSASPTATITHNYGSKDVGAWCRNSSDGQVFSGTATNATINTITLTFNPAFTGRCWAQPSVIGSGGGGAGSVTSVALSLPSEFVVTGSPVTDNGTLGATWASQTANKFLASPNGSSGALSPRQIVAADLPVISIAGGGTGANTKDAALQALMPAYTGNGGKCAALNTGATAVEWITCGGGSGGGQVSGTGLLGTGTSEDPFRVNPATVPTRISASGSLTFSAFSGTGNCEEQSLSVTGAAVGDVVKFGLPNAFPAGVIVAAEYISAADTAILRLCRLAGTNTISGATFTAQIVRSF